MARILTLIMCMVIALEEMTVFSFAQDAGGKAGLRNPSRRPLVTPGEHASKIDESAPLVPVEEFVRRMYPHGVPFNQIRAYERDRDAAVRQLSGMLEKKNCGRRPADGPVCSNILNTLGAIGGSEAVNAIERFIDSETSPGDKIVAISSLGYWVNTTSNDEALRSNKGVKERIKDVLDKLTFTAIPEEGKEQYFNVKFSIPIKGVALSHWAIRARRAGVLGLAFAGVSQEIDRTHEVLETLLSQAPVGSSMRAFILEALSAHNTIARVGVLCYYESSAGEMMSQTCRDRWRDGVITSVPFYRKQLQSSSELP